MENKEIKKWTYYFIDTTNIYIKSITNTAKSGIKYNSYYFYWADKKGNVILKFSTPAWNCFTVWDGENRYMLLRVDKSDSNENTIKLVQQLESDKAMENVVEFTGDEVFSMLVDDSTDSNDIDDE